MGLKGIITGIVAISLIGGAIEGIRSSINNRYVRDLRAYGASQELIMGTVLGESYENRLVPVPEKHISGLVSQAYSNPTVKIKSSYTLRVRTEDGRVMGISVIDGEGIKKEALDQIVGEGSKISFPTGNIVTKPKYGGDPLKTDTQETYVGPDAQTATKRAHRIRVL